MSDARSSAARYAAARAAGEVSNPDADTSPGDAAALQSEISAPMTLNAQNKEAFIETAIQQAIRRGDFDDLPGAGKPLEGLGTHHDPDWWIRRKIETENLTGLGPPALQLRVEDRELDGHLDLIHNEDDVRQVLVDFNRRVVEARRQLLGGPPVVTHTRDVDAEVRAWRERRAQNNSAAAAAAEGSLRRSDSAAETRRARRRRWFRRA